MSKFWEWTKRLDAAQIWSGMMSSAATAATTWGAVLLNNWPTVVLIIAGSSIIFPIIIKKITRRLGIFSKDKKYDRSKKNIIDKQIFIDHVNNVQRRLDLIEKGAGRGEDVWRVHVTSAALNYLTQVEKSLPDVSRLLKRLSTQDTYEATIVEGDIEKALHSIINVANSLIDSGLVDDKLFRGRLDQIDKDVKSNAEYLLVESGEMESIRFAKRTCHHIRLIALFVKSEVARLRKILEKQAKITTDLIWPFEPPSN